MLGVDIYRYQTITNWPALAHAVSYAWVKGTDGGGAAQVRADAQVRGCKSVGIPVGLYHYAQLSPSPEKQADVLTAEVRRLGATDLPPALDLEDPHKPDTAARAFSIRFLQRLRDNGFKRVAIYGNSSMFAAVRPDTMDIPGLLIWAADYGANNGKRNPDMRPYTGRVDVHQYTSVGRVPGITGSVDLNHAITNPIHQEDTMNADQEAKLDALLSYVRPPAAWQTQGGWLPSALSTTNTVLPRIEAKVDALGQTLSDDEANIIAVIRSQNQGLPPEQQAQLIRDQLDGSVLRALRALLDDTEETPA